MGEFSAGDILAKKWAWGARSIFIFKYMEQDFVFGVNAEGEDIKYFNHPPVTMATPEECHYFLLIQSKNWVGDDEREW